MNLPTWQCEGTFERGRIDKRRAIVKAARAIFLREGYAGATIDSVAIEAGVAKQTIYNHFHDKNVLFLTVARDLLENAGGAALAVITETLENPASLEVALRQLGGELARLFLERESAGLWRIVHSEIYRHPELADIWSRGATMRVTRALADSLARLADRGHLTFDDPDRAARQFLALVVFDPYLQGQLGARELSPVQVAANIDAAVSLFLRCYQP